MVLDLLSGKRREPAECLVKVGAARTEIAELYPFLSEVTVETSRREASVATLEFESRRDENGVWSVQDAGILAPWEPIVIEIAFGDHTEELFRGYIRDMSASYPEDASTTKVTVRAQDESLALDREHRREAWGAQTPTDDRTIVTTILGRHGLSLDPESGNGLTGLVLNQDTTDIRFLKDRAAANGYELLFQEGKVYFGPWRVDGKPQETILVYAGPDTNCYSFSSRADGHQPDSVIFEVAQQQGSGTTQQQVTSDLPLMGTESAESSGAGLGDFAWRMTRQGNPNEEELRARAQQRANETAMKVKADGELDGSLYGHVLRVGRPVGVDGVGEWLSGTYYVDSVSHRLDVEGYRERFRLLRNAYGDNLGGGSNPLAGIL